MKHVIWILVLLACNVEPPPKQHATGFDTTPEETPSTASGVQTVQVGDIEFRYDSLGRVVGKGDLELTYGSDGHLATARRGQDVWTYYHDQNGQRVLKKKNGRPVAAFINGTYIIHDKVFTPIRIQGRLIGVLEGKEFHLLGVDPRGTVITDRDGTPRPASPYGVRANRPDISEALDYIERGYDPVLGTVRMGVRDYDPYLGKFWTPDPLYFEEPERCITDPVSCNLYSYARNNPVSNIDPEGTSPAHGAFIGAGVGGAGEFLLQTYRWFRHDEPFQWSAIGAAAVEGAVWGSGGQYMTAVRGIAPWRIAAGGASLGAGAGTAGRIATGQDTTLTDVAVDASLGVVGAGIGQRLAGAYDRPQIGPTFIGPPEPPRVLMSRQGKHIRGHPNYRPSLKRSVLTKDPMYLAQWAGKGTPINSIPRGQPGFRERVDFGFYIGYYSDQKVLSPTRKAMIIYAKEGIHIVPVRP